MLGDVNTHELLALKRMSFGALTTARLTFPVSNGAGRKINEVTLFLISDSYLGLDQQYIVRVQGDQRSNASGQASTRRKEQGPNREARPVGAIVETAQDAGGNEIQPGTANSGAAGARAAAEVVRDQGARRHCA